MWVKYHILTRIRNIYEGRYVYSFASDYLVFFLSSPADFRLKEINAYCLMHFPQTKQLELLLQLFAL